MDYLKVYTRYALPQVKNSYDKFENFYKSNSMDLEDIEQEIMTLVWQIVEKKKNSTEPEEEIYKYIVKAVCFTLKDWVMSSVRMMQVEDNIFIFTNNTKLKKPQEVINEMRSVHKLTALEECILTKKYIMNKSLKQIAREEGLKIKRVHYVYIMLIKKYALKRKHHIQNIRFSQLLNSDTPEDVNKDEVELCIKRGLISTDEINTEIPDTSPEFFESIKPLLTELEYKIIYGVFVDEKTHVDLSKELSLTKQRVGQIQAGALETLKKKLKKDFTL